VLGAVHDAPAAPVPLRGIMDRTCARCLSRPWSGQGNGLRDQTREWPHVGNGTNQQTDVSAS
jgi:hypothetical protein